MNYEEIVSRNNHNNAEVVIDDSAIRIETTIGINPGYKHGNRKKYTKLFYKVLDDIIDITNEVTNIPVSFIVNESRAVYKHEFGCPPGGEVTYTLSTIMNPAFPVNRESFVDAVLYAIELIAKFYMQESICVTIMDIDGVHTIRYKYDYSKKEKENVKK